MGQQQNYIQQQQQQQQLYNMNNMNNMNGNNMNQFNQYQRAYPYQQQQQQQLRKEKQLMMEKYIKKASARVLWSESSGIESVSYSEIFNILRREFREQTNSIRIFEQQDLIEAFK